MIVSTREQELALSGNWVRLPCHDEVERALQAGFAVHWSHNVNQQLANSVAAEPAQQRRQRPSSWSQIGLALGMNPHHTTRYNAVPRGGERLRNDLKAPVTLMRYRVAYLFGVSDELLSPSTLRWIASGAQWLIRGVRGLSAEAREPWMYLAFASCMWLTPGLRRGDDLEVRPAAADLRLPGTQKQNERAALDVAQDVGEILDGLGLTIDELPSDGSE